MDLDGIIPENFIEEEIIKDLKSGKATKVITRCPPEPSGYWHIGHCKAWIIDFETAKKFGGYTILRMDDTNPKKEEGEFAESYLNDLKWLGYTPKKMVYASEEYFDDIYKIAEGMIKNGDAYVCSLTPEEVSKKRGTLTSPGQNSPYRNRTVEENLQLFHDMRDGKFKDGEVCLRAKIDMAHPNMNMRDPVMYRVVNTNHYRTKDKWCIYPNYDFAHPMEDCLEGTTFSLCDISFEDHRPVYVWFVENGYKKVFNKQFGPRQIEFSLLNLENVLTGKRYLRRLVNEGFVSGWDDPRLMTIVGMRRRGYTAQAIKNFVKANGVVKSVSNIPFSALEYHIRTDLNQVALRAQVVFEPLKIKITNWVGDDETLLVENNPNDELAGKHEIKFGKEIFIEKEDFALVPPPKFNRLTEGGVVRLKGAYIIRCNKAVLNSDGEVDFLECEYIKESRSGSDTSGIKCKGTIHFVGANNCFEIKIREIKNLIKPEFVFPQKDIENGTDLKDVLNENSLTETTALAENYLKTAKVEDKFQFMRKGYYCVDKDSTKDNLIFNSTISLKDSFNK